MSALNTFHHIPRFLAIWHIVISVLMSLSDHSNISINSLFVSICWCFTSLSGSHLPASFRVNYIPSLTILFLYIMYFDDSSQPALISPHPLSSKYLSHIPAFFCCCLMLYDLESHKGLCDHRFGTMRGMGWAHIWQTWYLVADAKWCGFNFAWVSIGAFLRSSSWVYFWSRVGLPGNTLMHWRLIVKTVWRTRTMSFSGCWFLTSDSRPVMWYMNYEAFWFVGGMMHYSRPWVNVEPNFRWFLSYWHIAQERPKKSFSIVLYFSLTLSRCANSRWLNFARVLPLLPLLNVFSKTLPKFLSLYWGSKTSSRNPGNHGVHITEPASQKVLPCIAACCLQTKQKPLFMCFV